MTSIESLTVEASDAADNLVASAALLVVVTIEEGAVDGGIVLVLPDSSSVMSNEGMSASELFGSDDIEIVAGGNGTATVTLECVEGLVDVAVSSVVFAPVLHFNGELNVNVTVSDQGSFGVEFADGTGATGVAMRAEDTLTVVVEAVNDAPEVTIVAPGESGGGGAVSVMEDGRSTVGDISIDVSDVADAMVDTAVLSVVVRVGAGTSEGSGGASGEGVLYVGFGDEFGAGVGGYDVTSGLGCVTGNGTAEAGCVEVGAGTNGTGEVVLRGREGVLSSALDALVFVAAADYNGTSMVHVELSDEGNAGVDGDTQYHNVTFLVNVMAVNDAPTLSVTTEEATFSIMEGATTAAGTLTVASEDDKDGVPEAIVEYRVSVDEGARVVVDGDGTGSAYQTLELEGGVTDVAHSDGGGTLVFRSTIGNSGVVFGVVTIEPATVEYNGTITVTVSVDDLGSFGEPDPEMGLSATDTVALTVVAVNDAPTLSVTTDEGTFSVAEDGVTNAGEVMVTSSDGADGIPSAIVEYTVSVDEGGVVELDGSVAAYSMAMTDGRVSDVTGGGEGGEGAGTASGTLVFRCTTGDSVDVFSAVVVRPAANFYGPMTVSVEVDDLGSYDGVSMSTGLTANDSVVLTVVAVNDVPTLSVTVGNGETLTIREDTMTSIESLTVEASDAADNLVASAALLVVVTIEEGAVDGGIVLVLPDSSSVMSNEGMSASELFGSDDIEIVAGGNGTATVTLECVEGLVDVAVSSVVFAPVLHFNGELNVNVTVSDQGSFGVEFADGTGATGVAMRAEDTLTVVVEAVNDAPEVTIVAPGESGGGGAVSVMEDGRSTVGDISIDVSDVADAMVDTAVLSVVVRVGAGTSEGSGGASGEGVLYVGFGDEFGAGVGGYDVTSGLGCVTGNGTAEAGCVEVGAGTNGTGEVVLRGREGVLSSALDALVFVAAADYNGTSMVHVELSDEGNAGVDGDTQYHNVTFLVNVMAVNDAPTLSVTTEEATFSIMEGATTAAGTLTVASEDDKDGVPEAIVEYRVSVDEGARVVVDGDGTGSAYQTLELEGGVTDVAHSDGGGTLVFRSTIGNSGVVFGVVTIEPATVEYNGTITVTVSVDDLGSFGEPDPEMGLSAVVDGVQWDDYGDGECE